MTINDMIKVAGWFPGNEEAWRSLSGEEQQRLAFKATGCLIAYATWKAPVDCRHIDCLIARGEAEPLDKTKGILDYEHSSGWLRWMDEDKYQQLRDGMCKAAVELGEFDPWKLGWQYIVGAALNPSVDR